jgi:aminopeptidase N
VRERKPDLAHGLALATALAASPLLAQEPPPIPAGVAPAPGAYAPGVNVLHYDVEIGLGSDAEWFAAQVDVDVAITERNPILPLDFTGLELTSVSIEGAEVPYTHRDGVLRIPLPGYQAGDELVVSIAYRGVPDDGLILRQNIHGTPSAFVDNWPNRTRFWLPSVDHPADKATVRYTVHAPAPWRVIANGHLQGEATRTPSGAVGPPGDRRTWVWEVGVPISPYNMVIGAADLEVRTVGLAACGRAPASRRADGCVEVTYWAYPEDVDKAEPSFRRAAAMVEHFTETIGPYPFEKLANVQSATRFGGMENASAIFYSERAISDGRNLESTVSHEIAHQWFGDAVTEASWHHLWLSEGFATYFGAQFFEAADGIEDFRERMEASRQRILASDDVERPIYDPAETDLFALLNDNNYPKGGWVLHMLRGIVGDDAFFSGIREYYRRHLHSAVLTEDFQAVMDEASAQNLEWFFRQWIYEPGYPVLDVSADWTVSSGEPGGTVSVHVSQVQKAEWPAFRLPMQLLVVQEGSEHRSEIELSGRETTIHVELPGSAEPSSVVLDPEGWVLKGELRGR